MIRTLQKRFVTVAMTAIALLLVALIGAINVISVLTAAEHSDRLLDFLLQAESRPFREPPAAPRREQSRGMRNLDEDARLSALYFAARVSADSITVDTERIASVTDAEATEYVRRAIDRGETDGRLDRFRYRATARDGDTLYVFLDTSEQTASMLRLLTRSALVGLIAFAVMLCVVVLLSKRAIKPIAANLERQKQFVTDAGHELKTPIAIILANIEALELHGGESKWSCNIREQAARLNDLTQNMLTLAKADEARKVALTEFSLSLLVEEYAEMLREPMSMRALTLATEIAEGVTVRAVRADTARVLSILLDNAARYAKEGSTVRLSLRGTCLRVENECDTLPDCPPEKLFDRFYRADGARTGGGYGIGLSAAEAILSAAGGTVTAEYIGTDRIAFTVCFGK